MSSTSITILTAATAMVAASVIPASAAPAPRCAKYASTAVEQHALNVRTGCGFAGPRWHTWWDGHYAWCLGQSKGRIKSETKKRRLKLAQCRFGQ